MGHPGQSLPTHRDKAAMNGAQSSQDDGAFFCCQPCRKRRPYGTPNAFLLS